ncbi:MAG: hypothetical protein ACP5HU_06390 [Phycisphaerae bacterium]
MGENDSQHQSDSPQRKPWGKYIFVVLIVVAGIAVWFSQRSGPTLEGWSQDLSAAQRQARQENRPILIFFHHKPMSATDRQEINEVLTHGDIRAVLEYEKILPVRLSVSDNIGEADQYGIEDTPAFVLLREGEEPKVAQEYLSVQQLTEFLESSVQEAREALSRQ